jgi:hypothetical protein
MKKGERKFTSAQIVVLVLVLGFIAYMHPTQNHEARFVDYSSSGLAIVPASGVSETSYTGTYTGTYTGSYTGYCPYAIEGGWDAYGRILYGYYTQRNLAVNGYNKCLNNNTANVFFVPSLSGAETAAFLNAAPGLNISVSDNLYGGGMGGR